MDKMYFAHRPPTVGVHLLNDPFPVRLRRVISPGAGKSTVAAVQKSKARQKKKLSQS